MAILGINGHNNNVFDLPMHHEGKLKDSHFSLIDYGDLNDRDHDFRGAGDIETIPPSNYDRE